MGEHPLVVAALLFGVLAVPVVAVPASTGAADGAAVDATDVSVGVTVARWNATAIAYRLEFDVPNRARGLRVLPYAGSVVRADGFHVSGHRRTLAWDGRPDPSLTLRYDVRRAAAADCTCVATDDWVLAGPLRVRVSVRRSGGWSTAYLTDWQGESTVPTTVAVEDGLFLPGVVFLGEYDAAETTTAAGERVRVVRPATAAGRLDEGELLDAVSSAAARFDAGPPPEETVTVVVVPKVHENARGVHVDGMDDRGRAVGNGYVYVDDASDATTWVHEYVHTRQTFTAGPGMRWFAEATAEYYGVRLAAGSEAATVRRVDEAFGDVPRSNGVLAVPETWESVHVPYRKGGQVVAYLDRRIRAATGGERTFLDVFRRLNGRDGLAVGDLKDATAAVVGDRSLDDDVDRYVTTGAVPARDGGIDGPALRADASASSDPVFARVAEAGRARRWLSAVGVTVAAGLAALLLALRGRT